MKNKILLIFLLLSYIFCFEKETQYHHLKIKFDYSNIDEDENTQLVKDLEEKAEFFSNLLFTDNFLSIHVSSDGLKQCDKNIRKVNFAKRIYINTDILIIPFFSKAITTSFEAKICSKDNYVPVLAILKINKKEYEYTIDSLEEVVNFYRLKLLKTLTKIIGFNHRILERLSIPNTFFNSPRYLTDKFYYSQSIKKYYEFKGLDMPKTKILKDEEPENSYITGWLDDISVPDYMRGGIKKNYTITELTLNLFKDFPFYRINHCDFEIVNNKCKRFDNKCFSSEQLFKDYFIEYRLIPDLENDKNSINVKCQLDNKENIKNNQCGVIEGTLLNDILEKEDYCINYELSQKLKSDKKFYYIPEIEDSESQTILLVTPTEACPKKHPRTVFFRPVRFDSREENPELWESLDEHDKSEDEKYKIEKVVLTDKKYFVTFHTFTGHKLTIQTLEQNGLIRSYLLNGNHNMVATIPSKLDLAALKKYQFLYRRVGANLSNKSSLYRIYDKMKYKFPKDYTFMPETFIYPEEKEEIRKKFGRYRPKKGNLWLIKPKSESEGRGIHILQNLNDEKGSFIITKYIENPSTIHGKKFDFRIYVLLTSVKPLSIYIHKQGLVRIASNDYTLDMKRLGESYIHLTNTAINTKSKNYIFNRSINSEIGNKWSLTAYRKYCKKNDIDFNRIWEKIKDIIIKTLLSIYMRMVDANVPDNVNDSNIHNLFGFDLLMDDDSNLYLLEVNDGPSLVIYDNMDKDIKTKLKADILNLIGIVPFSHDDNQKPMDEAYEYTDKVEEAVDNSLCEHARPKGDFEIIFPVKGKIQKYKHLFPQKLEENELIWKKIEEEN